MSAQADLSELVSNASEWEAELAQLGAGLATSVETSADVLAEVRTWIQRIDGNSTSPPDDVDPYFLIALGSAALHAERALATEDPDRRDALRVSLEQWRQVFRDIAEAAPVDESQPIRDVARWILDALDVPIVEIAALVGVSPRSYQRWANGESAPRPEEERRVRLIAHVALNLRHVLTGPGVVQWFMQPREDLKERRPSDLLEGVSDAPRLLMLATSARSMRAT